jgi:hypothetical protein
MLEEHPLIISLEAKINDLHRDRSTARKIVSSNSNLLTVDTAIEEYVILKQDLKIPLGIRYLALSCIAAQYQLYQDNREISQLKDLTGQAINIPTHAEVFNAIQVVKSKYYHIYDCDNREFDRVERLTKEMSPNLNEWGENISSPEADRHTEKDIGGTEKHKHYPNNDPTTSADSVFTNEQVQTILAAERAKNFQSILIMIGLLLVGGGVGISIISRQQPQVINTSMPQSTAAPSNVVDSTPIVATPSPKPIETPSPQVSQDEAVSLVQQWLQAKKNLFAPPFDRDSAASIMTGKAYKDKVIGPSSDGTPYSASQWLEKYGYYYSYGLQRIDAVKNFEVSGNNAAIDIQITEDVNLYNSKGELRKDKSGLEQKTIRYRLVKENGTLKIFDYNNLTASKLRL